VSIKPDIITVAPIKSIVLCIDGFEFFSHLTINTLQASKSKKCLWQVNKTQVSTATLKCDFNQITRMIIIFLPSKTSCCKMWHIPHIEPQN